jgi:hypothetical protein
MLEFEALFSKVMETLKQNCLNAFWYAICEHWIEAYGVANNVYVNYITFSLNALI